MANAGGGLDERNSFGIWPTSVNIPCQRYPEGGIARRESRMRSIPKGAKLTDNKQGGWCGNTFSWVRLTFIIGLFRRELSHGRKSPEFAVVTVGGAT